MIDVVGLLGFIVSIFYATFVRHTMLRLSPVGSFFSHCMTGPPYSSQAPAIFCSSNISRGQRSILITASGILRKSTDSISRCLYCCRNSDDKWRSLNLFISLGLGHRVRVRG